MQTFSLHDIVAFVATAVRYAQMYCFLSCLINSVLCYDYALQTQAVLAPSYLLYKDPKDGAAYTVPQGTELEVYRKVCEHFIDGEHSDDIALYV